MRRRSKALTDRSQLNKRKRRNHTWSMQFSFCLFDSHVHATHKSSTDWIPASFSLFHFAIFFISFQMIREGKGDERTSGQWERNERRDTILLTDYCLWILFCFQSVVSPELLLKTQTPLMTSGKGGSLYVYSKCCGGKQEKNKSKITSIRSLFWLLYDTREHENPCRHFHFALLLFHPSF